MTYRKNAAIATIIPPNRLALPKLVDAAPMKGVMVGVLLGEVVLEVEVMVKLAHVRRVALLLWMTTDKSPK